LFPFPTKMNPDSIVKLERAARFSEKSMRELRRHADLDTRSQSREYIKRIGRIP